MFMPLLLTLILATVFGVVFSQPMSEYAPYILSGFVVWGIIEASFVSGANAILGSEQYIRQISHPVIIYTLKWAVVTATTFLIALVGLAAWSILINPFNIVFGLFTLPLTLLIFIFLSWAITTFSAIVNTKYRDYPQIAALAIQAVWYFSSVFFKREMFLSSPVLEKFFYYNPINHLLELIRAPFLYGKLPLVEDYLFTIAFAAFWGGIAVFFYKCNKNDLIFYI
jgi:lipopolysaccharide transport system permease protein